MHALPRLSALNWLRLALIPAGGDWRDLPAAVAMPRRDARQNGGLGVNDWADPAHAVVAEGSVRNTWASVVDPRVTCQRREGSVGVTGWDSPSTTVIAAGIVQNGPWQVADPRLEHSPRDGGHEVQAWARASHTVIGDARVCKGSNVADPRLAPSALRHNGKYGIEDWKEPAHTVIGESRTGKSWAAVDDPRLPILDGPELDLEVTRPTHIVIRAADGAWHRPLTTLELAALQGFPVKHRGGWLKLDGSSHEAWRQRIGNAVPPPAAEAIARECRKTLEAARAGRLHFGSTPVWVSA